MVGYSYEHRCEQRDNARRSVLALAFERGVRSLAVADWVRPLIRATGASHAWHAPRIKSFTTVTYCEVNIDGPLEIAREDRAEREGCCATCATRLHPPTAGAAAVRQPVVKKAAATKSVNRPAAKKKPNKVRGAKSSLRRSRR